jgi:CRP/FNR family transcriptional regulator, anaerobic regulatory protein
MQDFIQYLTAITPLSQTAQTAILAKLKTANFPKNHILIPELAQCSHLFFIKKGMARAFYYDKGREITDWFGLERMIIGPVIRNFPMKEGAHSVELLTDTTVVYISFSDLQMLYDEHHEIERLGRCIAIQTLILMQQKIDTIQFLTAKERYQAFINAYPTILKTASLGQIASYLGMNQVTLSRIRKG